MDHETGKVFLLNSAVLTNTGLFLHEKASLEEARKVVRGAKQVVSAIGHEGTARLLSELLDVDVEARRVAIMMEHGDTAVVFRLLERLPEGKVLSEEELRKVPFELTILRHVCIDCAKPHAQKAGGNG